MDWKITPKQFTYPTGECTVTSIMLTAIRVDNTRAGLDAELKVDFNAHMTNSLSFPVAGTPLTAGLTNQFMADGLKAMILAGNAGYPEATPEERIVMEELAQAQANEQVRVIFKNLLFGSFEEAFGAVTLLAGQYGYELRPITEQ